MDKVKSILVSQPQPEGDKNPYFDLAQKHNLKIDFRSFIHVEGVDAKDFRTQKINILDHSAIILTIKNAADHFFRMCEETRVTVPEGMKYYCVSEAIAYYLQKYVVYRKRKIFFGGNTFSDLVEVLKKHKSEKFLLPCIDDLKPTILQSLDALCGLRPALSIWSRERIAVLSLQPGSHPLFPPPRLTSRTGANQCSTPSPRLLLRLMPAANS